MEPNQPAQLDYKEHDNLKQNYLDYDQVLEQVSKEVKMSRDFVDSRREEFRNRLRLYNNQRKQKDKVGDTSLFNVMNTMLAIYYFDEIQVNFQGRELTDVAQADNIQSLANFDHEEMNKEEIDYLTQWDRLFFGVGLQVINDWDPRRKVPVPRSIDALSWLPDPAGYGSTKNFRFMGFELEYLESEMDEESGFINQHLFDSIKKQSNEGSEQEQTRQALYEAYNLQETRYQTPRTGTEHAYDMIDIYTQLKGSDGQTRKFLVTVDDGCNYIFRCEELEPVTPEEKEDPGLVPFPVTLHYYSPTRGDPYGVSVGDLVEDKQRAKSILKNLRLAMRKADLYPMYIYNRDKIRNRRDLDFAFNKFIAVRGDVDQGVVQPLNKAPSHQTETLNDEQSFDRDVEISTGTDETVKGVRSEDQRTLGEVQQVQANANIRFLLGSKINAWGEKMFWKLWLRMYRQYMTGEQEKTIRIQNSVGFNFVKLRKKDFIAKQDPDIKIKSKLEAEQEKLKERTAFASIYPGIVSDPTKPLVAKRFAERKMLRLYGLEQDEISIISPETADEADAKMENELLSRNEKVDIEGQEDHLSHILIHNQAENAQARRSHIDAHKEAYVLTGQYEQMKQAEQMHQQQMGEKGTQSKEVNQNNINSKDLSSGLSARM